MTSGNPIYRRVVLALGVVVAVTLLVRVGASAQEAKPKPTAAAKPKKQKNHSEAPYDHLVYVTSTGTLADVDVWNDGNPLNSGDQVVWTVLTPGVTITSISMADAACHASDSGASLAFPHPVVNSSQGISWSGPYVQQNGTSGTSKNLYYKLNLSNGAGPCGRIIIKW